MSESNDTPVKASELIRVLAAGEIEGEIIDPGDAGPCLQSVSIEVDEDNRCTLIGTLAYREDDVKSCINDGKVAAKVLGVVFTRSFIYDDYEIEIDEAASRKIAYDGDLSEEDVLEAAESGIVFPDYNPDEFPFEDESVTDEEIIEGLEYFGSEFEAYALNEKGEVCAFESKEDVPETGFIVLTEEEAFKKLAADRPGIRYDF